MAFQDFTTWDENDPGTQLSVAANTITGSSVATGGACVDKDFGASHFSGEFTHYIDFIIPSPVSGNAFAGIWAISNTDDWTAADLSSDGLCFYGYPYDANQFLVYLECAAGYDGGDDAFNYNTRYYAKVVRASNNAVTVYCYTDSGHTTLAVTVGPVTYSQASRYLSTAWNDYDGSWSGSIYNLDLNEAVNISVTSVVAAATADAIAPAVSTATNATVTSVIAEATADGLVPAVSVTSNATVTGVSAEATADGIAPTVSVGSNVTVVSVIAEATADGIASTVSVTSTVTVTGVIAVATADGIAPVVSTNARETFEAESGSWTKSLETTGTGSAVTRSSDQARTDTYSAKCVTTNSSAYARVYDDTVLQDTADGYVWNRAFVYIPAATVSALSGNEYVELAGYFPSGGGSYGWWLQVQAGGELYARGVAQGGGSSSTFKVYGTIPTDQWIELEIGLHTDDDANGVGRSFAFLVDGDFYGWYHQGNLGTTDFDRTAFGIVGTNSADDLTVYVDDWYVYTAGQFPTGTDNRDTANPQEIDYRDLSGVQMQVDYSTWAFTHALNATYGLTTDSRIQSGKNHERIGNYDGGWALIEIGWPNGTPADTSPTGFFGPMIAFHKNIFTESNLEIVPYGGGDGTVTLRFESWPMQLGNVFATWALPEASIGGGSHIPEAGDKLLINWRAVNATTLHVWVDYYDASASTWTYNAIDHTEDVSAEDNDQNFMDADHGAVTNTIDSPDYSIKYMQFGDDSVALATATADGLAPAVSVTSNVTVTGVIAEATSDALAPAVGVTSDVTVTGVIAAATGDALVPAVSVTSNATIAAEIASATADAIAPTISVMGNVTIEAVIGAATAEALTPAVSVTSSVTIAAEIAGATADAIAPDVSVTSGIAIAAEIASATADALAPAVSVIRNVALEAIAAGALAEMFAPYISVMGNITIDSVTATATADALVPIVSVTSNVAILALVLAATADALAPTIMTASRSGGSGGHPARGDRPAAVARGVRPAQRERRRGE